MAYQDDKQQQLNPPPSAMNSATMGRQPSSRVTPLDVLRTTVSHPIPGPLHRAADWALEVQPRTNPYADRFPPSRPSQVGPEVTTWPEQGGQLPGGQTIMPGDGVTQLPGTPQAATVRPPQQGRLDPRTGEYRLPGPPSGPQTAMDGSPTATISAQGVSPSRGGGMGMGGPSALDEINRGTEAIKRLNALRYQDARRRAGDYIPPPGRAPSPLPIGEFQQAEDVMRGARRAVPGDLSSFTDLRNSREQAQRLQARGMSRLGHQQNMTEAGFTEGEAFRRQELVGAQRLWEGRESGDREMARMAAQEQMTGDRQERQAAMELQNKFAMMQWEANMAGQPLDLTDRNVVGSMFAQALKAFKTGGGEFEAPDAPYKAAQATLAYASSQGQMDTIMEHIAAVLGLSLEEFQRQYAEFSRQSPMPVPLGRR